VEDACQRPRYPRRHPGPGLPALQHNPPPTLLAIIIGVEGLIIGAVQLARGLGGAGWGAGILGIVSIIFGLILVANPFVAALALVVVLAVLAIIGGCAAIIIALRMHT